MSFKLDRRSFLASTAGFIALHPFSVQAATNQVHLRLMETTDLHVHVFPYDYYADKERDTVGLARTASIVRDIRAEATNSILSGQWRLPAGQPDGRLHRL